VTAQEREYMAHHDPAIDQSHLESVAAKSQREAEKLLKFACPTQAADGRWYRTTLAVSNVPVCELYNILSNMNFIARQLKEIAATTPPEVALDIEHKANQILALHALLRQRDHVGGTPIPSIFSGLNIHSPKQTVE